MPAHIKSYFYRAARQRLYAALAALSVFCPLGALPAAAKPASETGADAAKMPKDAAAANARSFYGAYLAGSYAADTGSPLAGAYLRRALEFRPQDKMVRRELLLSLIDDGDYPAAIHLAAQMRDDDDAAIAPIVRLILAADALKKQHYGRVAGIVGGGSGGDKNESLLWVFLTAWADYGRGQKSRALHNLGRARFSEWYAFLSAYNTALIQDLSHNRRQAGAAYQDAFHYRRLAKIAPEAYEHLVWAYVSFLQRSGGKSAAEALLAEAEQNTGKDNAVFAALRGILRQGKTIPPLVSAPAQGAAEFAYDIGSTFLRADEDLYADIYLQTAVFLEPHNDAALFRLGVLATKNKRQDKAESFFARLPQSSLYYNDMQFLTALSLNQSLADSKNKQKNAQAAAKLEKMLAHARDKTMLQNILANLYLQTENYPAAIAILNKTAAQIKQPQKEDWSIFFQRAIAYERLKNWDKAEADFREALRLRPKSADVLNYYGYSLVDRGLNLERGLDLVRQAAAQEPENGAVIDSLGWAYYKLGRYDEALAALEKAVRLEPGDSSINDHLGDAYWKTGDRLQAVFQWNHALAYQPEPEAAAKIREKLKYGLQETAQAKSAPPPLTSHKGQK